jgi:hypothetical protein
MLPVQAIIILLDTRVTFYFIDATWSFLLPSLHIQDKKMVFPARLRVWSKMKRWYKLSEVSLGLARSPGDIGSCVEHWYQRPILLSRVWLIQDAADPDTLRG